MWNSSETCDAISIPLFSNRARSTVRCIDDYGIARVLRSCLDISGRVAAQTWGKSVGYGVGFVGLFSCRNDCVMYFTKCTFTVYIDLKRHIYVGRYERSRSEVARISATRIRRRITARRATQRATAAHLSNSYTTRDQLKYPQVASPQCPEKLMSMLI